jgi:hypothetical protein
MVLFKLVPNWTHGEISVPPTKEIKKIIIALNKKLKMSIISCSGIFSGYEGSIRTNVKFYLWNQTVRSKLVLS